MINYFETSENVNKIFFKTDETLSKKIVKLFLILNKLITCYYKLIQLTTQHALPIANIKKRRLTIYSLLILLFETFKHKMTRSLRATHD